MALPAGLRQFILFNALGSRASTSHYIPFQCLTAELYTHSKRPRSGIPRQTLKTQIKSAEAVTQRFAADAEVLQIFSRDARSFGSIFKSFVNTQRFEIFSARLSRS